MKRFLAEKWRFIVQLLALIGFVLAPLQASAATVTTFSDTLSDSRPSEPSNHTINWDVVDAGGIVAGDTFDLNFADGFNSTGIIEDDIDIEKDTVDKTTAADCTGSEDFGVTINTTTDVISFTACTELVTITTGSVITVKVGTNATGSGTGVNQIDNSTAASYTISLENPGGQYTDTGEVQVAVISGVTTTATVSASISLAVNIVALGADIDDTGDETEVTDIASTATTIPFGTMVINTFKSIAQDLVVSTNAGEGYTTTIRSISGTAYDGVLTSTGGNIDGFIAVDDLATNLNPEQWAAGTNPDGVAANVDSGWYGYTTNDSSLGVGTPNRFTSPSELVWAPMGATAYEVAYSSAPVDAQTTRVGHRLEVNSFQPQGAYTGIIEYICTAIF